MRKIKWKSLGAVLAAAALLGAGSLPGYMDRAYAAEAVTEAAGESSQAKAAAPGKAASSTIVKVNNGVLKGTVEENGVYAWKGVPYAKAPVGARRWKAPEPAEDSSQELDATEYGAVAPQYSVTFDGITLQQEPSEDCLNLNIWAADTTKPNKAVMVYFHGGGYGFGTGKNPLFNGANFVKEYPDVIMVTINYRLGMFGFIDLSTVEGGENYPDSGHLGLLDQLQSLRWVKKNIAAFGGNPDNITIFGESAGAGSINTILTMDFEEGLFQRAIMQSGGLALTNTREQAEKIGLTQELLRRTGAKSMADLIKIPSDKLLDIYTARNANGVCLNDLLTLPIRDGVAIPLDGYATIKAGKAKNIDIMVGATANEFNYWLEEFAGDRGFYNPLDAQPAFIEQRLDPMVQHSTSFNNTKQKATMVKYWKCLPAKFDHFQRYSEYINDVIFRVPSLMVAADHAAAGGNSYVYYFGKESTKPGLKACHSVEVAYVFNNPEIGVFAGEVNTGLAKKMSNMWANFARTGDPSIKGLAWDKYEPGTRMTLVVGNNNSLKMQKDYLGLQRAYTEDIVKNGHYWELASYICGWTPNDSADWWRDGQ